jgi:purine-binding chemotaxis protein CheW
MAQCLQADGSNPSHSGEEPYRADNQIRQLRARPQVHTDLAVMPFFCLMPPASSPAYGQTHWRVMMQISSEQARTEKSARADQRAGKYLTFMLGKEDFGVEILKVREIIGTMDTTAVPGMPDYVLGVINLRGKVIPVLDLRLKFGMAAAERTPESCIIVVDVNSGLMGVMVDRVSEVADIRGDDIEDAPDVGVAVDNSFILGMAKSKGHVKILLAIAKVLSEADNNLIPSL